MKTRRYRISAQSITQTIIAGSVLPGSELLSQVAALVEVDPPQVVQVIF